MVKNLDLSLKIQSSETFDNTTISRCFTGTESGQ